jgi:hypothetical protein
VKAQGLEPGTYDLFVDGLLVESFETNSGGGANLKFMSGPGPHGKRKDMTFDPRYKLIEVSQLGTAYFSGLMLADVNVSGLDACGFLPLELELTLDPAQTEGSGHASLGSDVDCGQLFTVSAADLAAGDYDIVVNGVVEGTLSVSDIGGGATAGEATFVAVPDEAGEQVLDFDPRGQVVEIRQGATVVLTGLFPL